MNKLGRRFLPHYAALVVLAELAAVCVWGVPF